MDTLIESIRAAMSADATDETRAAGAQACRTILAALEAKPGEPLTLGAPASSAASDPSSPAAQIAQMVAALRGLPADQLLDLAIARMRAALPSGIEAPRVEPLKFHIVQLPTGRRP